MIPTKGDLEILFNIYDEDGSGSITYKEFSTKLFGKSKSTSAQPGS